MRAISPDRLPYVGPLPDEQAAQEHLAAWAGGAPAPRTPVPHRPGWWCSLGHGSRGLTGAGYAAAMLADSICGWPPSTPAATANGLCRCAPRCAARTAAAEKTLAERRSCQPTIILTR